MLIQCIMVYYLFVFRRFSYVIIHQGNRVTLEVWGNVTVTEQLLVLQTPSGIEGPVVTHLYPYGPERSQVLSLNFNSYRIYQQTCTCTPSQRGYNLHQPRQIQTYSRQKDLSVQQDSSKILKKNTRVLTVFLCYLDDTGRSIIEFIQ